MESAQSQPAFVPPVRRLLAHLIDYAGLYPPAALKMTSAVHNYACYRSGEGAWALGNFVVNASRLDEFENEMAEYLPLLSESDRWCISALCGPPYDEDFRAVDAFNSRHRALQVAAVEMRITGPGEIAALAGGVPRGLPLYCEFPMCSDPVPFFHALAKAGARAKIRTGGTSVNLFPSTTEICDFLTLCCRHNVPFKATAGLHHAFCGSYRLTYDAADTRTAIMHGFLNVFLGAVFIYAGIRAELLPEVVGACSPQEFGFDERGISWRHHWASNEQIDEARAGFAVAFGSCSFDEPLRELRHLNLL